MAEYNGKQISLYTENLLPSFTSWNLSNASTSGSSLVINNGGTASIELDKIVRNSSYLNFAYSIADTSILNNYNNKLYIKLLQKNITYEDNNEEELVSKNNIFINMTSKQDTTVESSGYDARTKVTIFNNTGTTVTINSMSMKRSKDVSDKQIVDSLYDGGINLSEVVLPIINDISEMDSKPIGAMALCGWL